jgi:hypothetical protein
MLALLLGAGLLGYLALAVLSLMAGAAVETLRERAAEALQASSTIPAP